MYYNYIILEAFRKSLNLSQTDVADYFNCNISNISQMLKKGTYGKRGKTRYYKFEYNYKK